MPSPRVLRTILCTLACGVIGLGVYDTAAAQPGTSSDPDAPHDRRFQLVGAGLIGHPLGEFADNVDTSWGGGFDFVYRVGDGPVWFGAGVGVLRYDRATHEVPFSLTVPDVLVEVTTSNNLVMPYGLVRFQSSEGTVRPYVEGRVGFNYLFTQTSVEGSDSALDIARTTNFSDVAPSIGAGAGVAVALVDWSEGRFGLDIGVRYVYGGRLDYLIPGSRGFDDGVGGLEHRRSRTDLFLVRLGVSLEF